MTSVSTRNRALAGLGAGIITGILLGFVLDTDLNIFLDVVIYAVLGLIFGVGFGRKIKTIGAGLIWGEAYGILWWVLGSLTLIPLFRGLGVAWDIAQLQQHLPLLFGQVLGVGVFLGMGYVVIVHYLEKFMPTAQPITDAVKLPIGQDIIPPTILAAIVGGLGGTISAGVYLWGIETGRFFPLVASIVGSNSMGVGQFLHYGIGLIIGVSFGLLFSRDIKGVGPGIIWGVNYGLLWWILGTLTLFPAFTGEGFMPDWTIELAQSRFAALVAHVLYGALVGFFYSLFNQLWRALFIDTDPVNRSLEGIGTRSFRSLLMGQAGGLVGGIIFGVFLSSVGAFPGIARIVGSDSGFVGLVIHFIIGVIIGSTFGLLFQREAFSYGTGMAWGMVYALLWWFLGSMTLYAVLTGTPIDWSIDRAIAFYPNLIGHLLYGGGLGLFFQFLARRYDDTVSGRVQLGTLGTRLATLDSRKPPVVIVGRPATALWVVTLVLGILLPLLLLTSSGEIDIGY